MKSPLKLSAAAVILIAAILSLTLLDKIVAPAYAIEQTIEAMRQVSTVHCFARDWQDREMEMWIKVNPETGENDCHYIDEPGQGLISISTPRITYFYHTAENLVRIVEGKAIRSDIRFGRFIEDVIDRIIGPEHGDVQITKEHDPSNGREVIRLRAESKTYKMNVLIDPETKLPIQIDFDKAVACQGVKHVDRLYYNEPLPEGLFDFQIPNDAQVKWEPVINKSEYGISAEGLTEEETRIQIITEFWDDVIGRDFESAHRLLPVAGAAEIERTINALGGAVELISIGESFEAENVKGAKLTPVRIRFGNGKVYELYQITRFRTIDGKSSCVLAGEGKKAEVVE